MTTVVGIVGLLDRLTPTPPVASRAVNLAVWGVLAVLLVSWQVVTAAREHLPSAAALVQVMRRRLPTRWLLLAGWVWLGWHTFVRGNWG